MKILSENWITEKLVDLEYKQYILLAYLKEIKKEFRLNKLFPHFEDLKMHHQILLEIENNTDNLFNNFPRKSTGINLKKLQLEYKTEISESFIIKELKQIVQFSIPQIASHLEEGKQIYEFLENQINIDPVGIVPLNFNEGYFLVEQSKQKEYHVFQYKMSFLKKRKTNWHSLDSKYLMCFNQSIKNSIESIKHQIIDQYKQLPNPATFVVTGSLQIPFKETYLPLAKLMLEKHLSHQENQNNYIN